MKEIIFLSGVLLAAGKLCLTNAQPGFDRDDSDASLPSPSPLKRGCNTAADCGNNEYCGGRGTIKRCIDCFDCTKVMRKRRTNYDGPACATHPTDCGQCNDGYDKHKMHMIKYVDHRYEEYAGLCINQTSFPSTFVRVDPYQVPNVIMKEAQESGTPVILPIGGGIIAAAFLCLFMIWGIHERYYKHGVRFQNEEETGLTRSNMALDQSPTAPPPPPPTEPQQQQPEEYKRPPPIYVPTPPRPNGGGGLDDCGPHKAKRPRWGENRFRVNDQIGGALPFCLGNGASNIIVRDMTYSDDEEVDGGVPATDEASLPHPSNQESRTPIGTGFVGNMDTPGATAVPPARTPNLASERAYAPPSNLPSQPPSHASPPHGATPPLYVNDPVHGYVGVRWAFEMQVANFNNPNYPPPPHPPQPQPPQRNVVSAPASPRGIDDTHINWEMSEIQSFVSPPSVMSIDSGTASGSNDGQNEVPSRSFSRADIHGFSDTEMSLFDFEETMEGND